MAKIWLIAFLAAKALGGFALLFFDGLKRIEQAAENVGEQRNKIGGHGVHGAEQLTKELFLGRQLGQGFNLFGRHFLAFQAAAAQLEQLALLSKITQRLGHRHGVIETKGNGAVVVELVLDNVMRATGKSDTGQRVLDDVEFAASLAQVHTEVRQLFHRHALELGQHRKRSTIGIRFDRFNDGCFFRPGHVIPLTFGVAGWNAEPKISLDRWIKGLAACLPSSTRIPLP